jgi:CRP/FNR family transcriptional regulator, cyclic AMP receptor protein
MRKVLYIFGLLTDADVEWMARNGARRRLRDGEAVITQGKQADTLVLLLEGEFVVTAEGFGQVATMGVGEIVGEISLVDSAPPSATVTARGDCTALFLDKATLMHKLDSDPGFGSRFYRALAVFLADRLRATRRLSGAPSGIADATAVMHDELDTGILDNISAAGERFNRMLKVLSAAPLS